MSNIFRGHNHEADSLANLGAEGQRKIIVETSSNTENWKAVRGFSDGSNKTDGRSGGVVIKGVDQDKRITISKNYSTADCLYSHGSRSGECLCSNENFGLGAEKDNQCSVCTSSGCMGLVTRSLFS